MSQAKPRLNRIVARYLISVGAPVLGLLWRVAMIAYMGHPLPTYITFYPAVMLAAVLGGLWPGLVATAVAALLTAYFVLPPEGFSVGSAADVTGLVLFIGMGIFMSLVADRYRRTRDRAAAYEKTLALRESQEALQKTEERWAITLRSIGDAVLTTDARGCVAFLNPVAEKLTGWTTAEAAGQPVANVFRIVREDTGEPVPNVVEQVLREGHTLALVNHTALLTKTGRKIPIEDSAAPICDAGGKVSGVVLVFHDVTERRQTQEALRRSEERLRVAAMAAEIGAWYWTPGTSYVEVSANWRRLFGVSPDVPVTFETWCNALHPDDRERAVRELNAASEQHHEFDVEYRALRPDGSIRWIVDRGHAWYDQKGMPAGMAGVNVDVTERKQAEQALRTSEQRVRAKLESILSPEGDIGTLELADIIDAPALQELMEDFHKLAQIPMAIIDMEGKVLVGVGWQDVCTQFHRVNPESCKHCIESDVQLSAGVPAGEFKLYHCKNHMWDVATPIVVGGKHVGNVFTGQFFFEGEKPDLEVFRAQARQYSFDESAYLAALDRVPRLTRERLNAAMEYFVRMAEMISKLSYSNIKLARSLGERDTLTASLRANEAHLQYERDLLQAVMDGARNSHLVFLDRDFNFVRVNQAYARTCGYTPEAMIGKNHFALYPNAENQAIFARVRDTGEPTEFHDKPFVFPDQPERGVTYWDWTLMPVKNDAGEVAGLIFSLIETTERKRMEQALQESYDAERARAEELQSLMDAVPAVVWIAHDSRGGIITGNRASYELLRLPFGVNTSLTAPEDQRPANFRACRNGVEIPGDQLPVQRAARGETVRDDEFELVFADGTLRYMAGSAVPLFDAEGKPRGAVSVFMDVTERKRAEAALIRSEKLASVGRMAAAIAHEINNPLAAVMNTLFLARTNAHSPQDVRKYLETADEELRRVAHLTRQSLGFYRESSAPEPLYVSDVLYSSIDLLKSKTRSKGATIETECDDSAQVTGLSGELRQVFTNLLANSLDALEDGGVIKVRVSNLNVNGRGRRVRITVADNGIGIERAALPRLFEPFFTTKDTAGTGLGLWVSKQIIDKHRGMIRVHSRKSGPYRGTTFSLVLPAESASVPELAAAAGA